MTKRLGGTARRRTRTLFTRVRVAGLAALGVVALTGSVALADSDKSEHPTTTQESTQHHSGQIQEADDEGGHDPGDGDDDGGEHRGKTPKPTPGKPAPTSAPTPTVPSTAS